MNYMFMIPKHITAWDNRTTFLWHFPYCYTRLWHLWHSLWHLWHSLWHLWHSLWHSLWQCRLSLGRRRCSTTLSDLIRTDLIRTLDPSASILKSVRINSVRIKSVRIKSDQTFRVVRSYNISILNLALTAICTNIISNKKDARNFLTTIFSIKYWNRIGNLNQLNYIEFFFIYVLDRLVVTAAFDPRSWDVCPLPHSYS